MQKGRGWRRAWAMALLLCPPLVVWAHVAEGCDALQGVAERLEMTERRAGVVALSCVAAMVGYHATGGTMAGWIIVALMGAVAGAMLGRPYWRQIWRVRTGRAAQAVVDEAERIAARAEAETQAEATRQP